MRDDTTTPRQTRRIGIALALGAASVSIALTRRRKAGFAAAWLVSARAGGSRASARTT